MGDYFELCEWEKFKIRTKLLLLESVKVFLCGMMWQVFAIISPRDEHSTDYYFLTGFGASLGSLMGHWLINLNYTSEIGVYVPLGEIVFGFIEAFAVVFGPETAWQQIVNSSIKWDFSFTGAFFFMFLCIFLFVMVTSTTVRFLIKIYASKEISFKRMFGKRFYLDLQAATAFGLGDAFFVGTENRGYKGNWLKNGFGVKDNTPVFEQMMKAGASVWFGYVWISFLYNLFLKDSYWDAKNFLVGNLHIDKDWRIKRRSLTADTKQQSSSTLEVSELTQDNPMLRDTRIPDVSSQTRT